MMIAKLAFAKYQKSKAVTVSNRAYSSVTGIADKRVKLQSLPTTKVLGALAC